ncbi:methyl-accepting chemotaxis protein [Alkaliphilus serpentinus]|uniref:Methyl-accepting chemotaxis protein n=1 Tax=Alkaliphilus serpentinus TaxID=1482731 RepID=A0A833MAA8_9FIRM|nr:methyl-accepting chemotaxis protein [Alkaliphilus serpentinus]KAB3531795.1 methyl-accepting chemotaxis protein [Alkaliphilus serpentinus]
MFGKKKLINEMITTTEKIAQGDLTTKLEIKSKSSLGKLAATINRMILKVRNLIGQVSTANEKTLNFAKELEENTRHIYDSSQEVANAITDIASEASLQNEALMNVKSYNEEMETGIDEILTQADETRKRTNKLVDTVKESSRVFERVVDVLDQNSTWSLNLSNKMNDLKEEVEKIQKITSFVTQISENTNLLALNASIEAARAGEAGKGFSVVANEVRKLAEQSAEFAKDIESIVDSIALRIVNISEEIIRETEKAKEDIILAKKSKEQLGLVIESTENTSAAVEKIHSLANKEAGLVKEVSSSIEKISLAVEKSAAFSQEAAASTEEQTASLHIIFESIKKMGALAKDVQDVVVGFVKEYQMDDKTINQINRAKDVLKEISLVMDIVREGTDNLPKLKKYLEENHYFHLLSMMDFKGDIVAIVIRDSEETISGNVGHRPYFQQAIMGEEYTSEPYISLLTNNYCVTIALPIIVDQQIKGIVMGDISLE